MEQLNSAATQAVVGSVRPGSPADDAGFTPGCSLLALDGEALRDIIDWRWLSAGDRIELSYVDTEGDSGTVELVREPGEDWGFEFETAIFDGIKTCRNACTFCFMRQLPEDVRPSLVLRDDDFRLSFLQGTFVTFTNLSAEDEARIIEQRISPLRMSLHAANPAVRSRLIGRHASHGLEAAVRLLDAGIEIHAQIVLVPGENDGNTLSETLAWAYRHPGILTVGIVPLGFTKHQETFSRSFNTAASAQGVIERIRPFQERSCAERGTPWVYAADEFYRNAHPQDLLDHLPDTGHYGDFAMFEDGIGIIRSTVDDWMASEDAIHALAAQLAEGGKRVAYVVGYAQREFLIPLVAESPLAGSFVPFPVANEYFGGNVDVTGLLCGCDITAALVERGEEDPFDLVALPEVIFNADGLTLDDMSLEDMQNAVSTPLAVVSCNPSEYLEELSRLL